MNLKKFEVLTFDCYGTLIDWESGILTALRAAYPDAHAFGGDRLLEEFHAAQNELKERLFFAYLHEGLPISDHRVLAEAANDVGLPGASVAELLQSDRFADAELPRDRGAGPHTQRRNRCLRGQGECHGYHTGLLRVHRRELYRL